MKLNNKRYVILYYCKTLLNHYTSEEDMSQKQDWPPHQHFRWPPPLMLRHFLEGPIGDVVNSIKNAK